MKAAKKSDADSTIRIDCVNDTLLMNVPDLCANFFAISLIINPLAIIESNPNNLTKVSAIAFSLNMTY
jgi:hypothetical protein